jgi:hypothetical protein
MKIRVKSTDKPVVVDGRLEHRQVCIVAPVRQGGKHVRTNT